MKRERVIAKLVRWHKQQEKAHFKALLAHDYESMPLRPDPRDPLGLPRTWGVVPFPSKTPVEVQVMVTKLHAQYQTAGVDVCQKYLTVIWLLAFAAWFPDEMGPLLGARGDALGDALAACDRLEASGWKLDNSTEMYALLFDLQALDVVREVWGRL